jgi:hypothetical protein
MYLSPEMMNLDVPIFLGCDLRGRGLARAKSAPSSKAISRWTNPYDRLASQTDIFPCLEIPNFVEPTSGPAYLAKTT